MRQLPSYQNKGETTTTIEDYDTEVVLALTDDEEEREHIGRALLDARSRPDYLYVTELQESMGLLLAWYPVAQRMRMGANGDKENKQFMERYIAGAIEALKSNLIASMWLGNLEKRLGGI